MMDFEDILRINADKVALLHAVRHDGKLIEIHQHDGLRWICTGGDSIQSLICLDKPTELLLANTRAMLAALLLCAEPRNILNLGFGAGAFERFFRDRLPLLALESVDSNPILVDLARMYFQVPADWPVVIETAERYLRHCQSQFSVIFCDIFTGAVPADCLFDADFYADAARCLADDGVMALNLSPDTEAELLRSLLVIRESFNWVLLIKVPDHGNIVLLLSKLRPPADSVLQQRAAAMQLSLGVDLTAVLQQLNHLPPRHA